METERFRQAVSVGLGRAILHLRQHPWKPHADAIERVWLHNTAYDPQVEGTRAAYVYEIVRLTDDLQHFYAAHVDIVAA